MHFILLFNCSFQLAFLFTGRNGCQVRRLCRYRYEDIRIDFSPWDAELPWNQSVWSGIDMGPGGLQQNGAGTIATKSTKYARFGLAIDSLANHDIGGICQWRCPDRHSVATGNYRHVLVFHGQSEATTSVYDQGALGLENSGVPSIPVVCLSQQSMALSWPLRFYTILCGQTHIHRWPWIVWIIDRCSRL